MVTAGATAQQSKIAQMQVAVYVRPLRKVKAELGALH